MVLTDAPLLKGRDPVDACRAAVRGGATAVQVRQKDASPRDLATLARALVGALAVPVLVNDRVDVALAVGAAGAHLGHADVPLDAVRPVVPPGFLLGISVGSLTEAERARAWPADYWSVGPCFETAHKDDAGPALGEKGFRALAQLAPPRMPVIGIGGITALNAPTIVNAGATGIAALGAIWEASDSAAAARALRSAIA